MVQRHKAHLGQRFERLVEAANREYEFKGRALIEKQEVAKAEVNGKMIYAKKGLPDFMGLMNGGRSVIFDAKSTRNKTSFPLNNLLKREHQLDFLYKAEQMGAAAFYLIEFAMLGRYFILPANTARVYVEQARAGGRKSIPLHEFAIEVEGTWENCLDYLLPFEKGVLKNQ